MYSLGVFIVGFSCLLTLCQTQIYSYPSQRSSYKKPSALSFSYSNSISNPSYANAYYKQLTQKNPYPYSKAKTVEHTTAPSYTSKRNSVNRNNFENILPRHPSYSSFYSNPSYSSSVNNKQNLNRNSSDKIKRSYNNRISKADAENAKFVGAANQESEPSGRTLFLKRRKIHHRFGRPLANPCSPYGRDAGRGITPPPSEQGRFLWDISVYNLYPHNTIGLGCGGYGGFGGGLLSDPIGPAYYPPGSGIANFLSLFAPGILQNSLAVTTRPQQYADYGSNVQSDPEVDPNYTAGPASVPVRRPNQVFYDSAGAPPVTPGQLVGGISTTVNGIIQQLTGNVQPLYG